MEIKLNVLLGSGRLGKFVNQINWEFSTTVRNVKKKVPISNIDVVMYDNPQGVIPEIGIGGYTPCSHTVFISLNPLFPDFSTVISKQLKRILAHELHHVMRWESVGYGSTLFEALITEGLADHFEAEINGDSPMIWDVALNDIQREEMRRRAEAEYDSKNYDHHDWFFGSKEMNIPKWSGYSLGFHLVADYLTKHPRQHPSMLRDVDAKKFR